MRRQADNSRDNVPVVPGAAHIPSVTVSYMDRRRPVACKVDDVAPWPPSAVDELLDRAENGDVAALETIRRILIEGPANK